MNNATLGPENQNIASLAWLQGCDDWWHSLDRGHQDLPRPHQRASSSFFVWYPLIFLFSFYPYPYPHPCALALALALSLVMAITFTLPPHLHLHSRPCPSSSGYKRHGFMGSWNQLNMTVYIRNPRERLCAVAHRVQVAHWGTSPRSAQVATLFCNYNPKIVSWRFLFVSVKLFV